MSKRRISAFARNRAGASAVEFGMVALPLLLCIFGIIEFGRVMWTREALQQTAIAGARCMGVVMNTCGTAGVYSSSLTTSYIQTQAAHWSLTIPASNISLNSGATCAGVSGFSQVTLTYTFRTVVPGLIKALAGGTNLSATACFPNAS
jgi:Flp pilus assembly protein TadG